MTFSISGRRRPYRSAMRPKTIAPIGRVMSARPTVHAMSERERPKAVATSWMTKVRTKKSNASSVQPRNPARTALRWFARSAAFMSGRRILLILLTFQTGGPVQHHVDRRRLVTNGHVHQKPSVFGDVELRAIPDDRNRTAQHALREERHWLTHGERLRARHLSGHQWAAGGVKEDSLPFGRLPQVAGAF